MPELRVKTVVIEQNGIKMYTFAMRSDALRKLSYVLPRSKDNPAQIQRVLSKRRLEKMGEYLKSANGLLPNNIVVNLNPDVAFIRGASEDAGILVFPDDGAGASTNITDPTGKFAYVLDGQHRLAGFEYAGSVVFDLPVTAFLNIDHDRAAQVFSDINSNQAKVSAILLHEIMQEIGTMPRQHSAAAKITEKLGEQGDSPWRDMIKSATRKGQMSPVTMTKYLVPLISNDGPLVEKSESEQVTILKNYFAAFRAMFPGAWGSRTHVLTKGIGLHLMSGLFRRAYDRCEKYEGGDSSQRSFERQLAPLAIITWDSATYGKFSNAKGMKALWLATLPLLPLTDNADSDDSLLSDLGIQ